MQHADFLPALHWAQIDHANGAVSLVSRNPAVTIEIRATYHRDDDLTEITISTNGSPAGHTSFTGAPGSTSFSAVVDELKVLAARRLFLELTTPGSAIPEELDF